MEFVDCDHKDPLEPFLRDGYCEKCGQFDEQAYLQNWHQIYYVSFGFICNHNLRQLKMFEGDAIAAMLASEIWRFNIGKLLEKQRENLTEDLAQPETRRRLLPKCNTYSLSQYLGIPSQTASRKIKKLIDCGWVERSPKGELSITADCEEAFKPEFNLETIRNFLSASKFVISKLGAPHKVEGK
ncbi:MAG: hypothetical protein RIR18_2128 [Pseudomonadota bacterium]|jgi:hypothetical protein